MAQAEGLSGGDVAPREETQGPDLELAPEAEPENGTETLEQPEPGAALRRIQQLEEILDGMSERMDETRRLLAALLWSVDHPVEITPEAFMRSNAKDVDITSSLAGGRTVLSIRGRVYVARPSGIVAP